MSIYRKFFSRSAAARCAAIAIAASIFTSTPTCAQQKPMVITPNASNVKAQTIISRSGSYILNRNIVNKRVNAASVSVTASNVTINLQGFSITSTVASPSGIDAGGQSNIVITNGIISGFGGPAIIAGTAATISGITATGNGSGITCGPGCLARGNVLQGNTGVGLNFSDATSGYIGNILQGNNGGGAQVSGGTSLGQNLCDGVAC